MPNCRCKIYHQSWIGAPCDPSAWFPSNQMLSARVTHSQLSILSHQRCQTTPSTYHGPLGKQWGQCWGNINWYGLKIPQTSSFARRVSGTDSPFWRAFGEALLRIKVVTEMWSVWGKPLWIPVKPKFKFVINSLQYHPTGFTSTRISATELSGNSRSNPTPAFSPVLWLINTWSLHVFAI